MSRSPAARASAARDNVNFAEVYRPGSLAQIREGIPKESLEAIDETPGVSWLEFEHDHWLMDRTMAVLGLEDAVACWRLSLAHLVERPLLRNFVDGAMRLFGAHPGKMIKMIPKGWPLAYRDFCNVSYHPAGDNEAELHFENIAPQAFESVGYLHCWHGICLGVLDLSKPEDGRVEFDFDPGRATATARFRWR